MPSAILQFSRDGERLLVSYLEGATRVDSVPFEGAALLERWARDFHDLMENALAFPLTDHRATLEDFGRCLFDNLLTGDLGDHLRGLARRDLLVDLPESLLWLPVEIVFDGSEFLGLRHAVGRRITAWESRRPARRAVARRDGHERPAFLLVAGHADDDAFYEETRREVYELCDGIERSRLFELRELLVDNAIERADLLRALSSADYIHFSGHSDGPAANGDTPRHAAGWVFEDYRLTPDDIAALNGCDPFFVFSNSCRSGAVSNWRELRDMVRAFWERGTQHFLGAATRIHYQRAAEFAEAFYADFLDGTAIGEAVRRARHAIVNNPAHHDVCWLAYTLYGDPAFALAPPPPPPGDDADDARAGTPDPDARPASLTLTLTTSEAPRSPAPEAAPPAAAPLPPLAPTALPAFATERVACGWTGKPIRPAAAVACAAPGCGALIGTEGQLQQRRLWLDMAVHGAAPMTAATGQGAVCRAHMPDALRAWVEKTTGAAATIHRGEAVCAWTGRAATRSEMLTGAFRQTPHGFASPEAVRRYTCAATGELIPPDLARADRGFIDRRGRLYGEAGWWATLRCADRPAVARAAAEAALRAAWSGMLDRLRAARDLRVGDRTYASAAILEPPVRDTDFERAWIVRLAGGALRADLLVGLLERTVVHLDHYDRFGHDRQPAGLDDLTRAARHLDPVDGAPTTLALLASPTGWDDAAIDHVRRLEPGRTVLLLRHAGAPMAPLAFNRAAQLAEALKLELAGAPKII